MVSGVQKVTITAPAADVAVGPYEALALGTIALSNMGRAT
jgi:hypothetical protein